MARRLTALWVLVGMMSVLIYGKAGFVLAQTAPLILPGQTATYVFRGTQIDTLVTFAENQNYGFPLKVGESKYCVRSVRSFGEGRIPGETPEEEYEFTLRTKPFVSYETLGVRAILDPLTTLPATCEFGFFEGKRLQPGWKLRDVRLGRPITICGDGEQSTSVFSKIPIRLSDDASFRVRVRYEGMTYLALTECHRRITLDYDVGHRIYIERIVLQGPSGSDWRMAFRDRVTPPPRRR